MNTKTNPEALYTSDDWHYWHCSICDGKDGRCSRTEDGAFAVCYKYNSKAINVIEGAIGTYGTYILDRVALEARQKEFGVFLSSEGRRNLIPKKLLPPKSTKTIPPEIEQILNSVHEDLLSKWSLSSEHRTYLRSRGFTDEQIKRQRYATSASHDKLIQPLVSKYGPDLLKVPGFVQMLGKTYFRSSEQLIIPTINSRQNIVNFRTRTLARHSGKNKYFYISSHSKNNPSGLKAYTAAHVIVPEIISDESVWITEGEFKAHLSSEKLQTRFISIPGVGSWRLALEALEDLKAKTAVLAFDNDLWTNKEVAKSLIQLHTCLKGEGYETQVARW